MTKIALTVTQRAGLTVASVSEVFNDDFMTGIKTNGTGTEFFYPGGKGSPVRYVVSESLTTVEGMQAAVSTSISYKKKLSLLFDATGGKAIGTYALVDLATGAAATLPIKAIITRAWYENITTFTSATDAATIALGVATDAAAGIKAAIAISNGANPYDAGLVEGIPTGTVATMTTKTTAERNINAVVAEEALTAGKLALFIEYFVSI